MTLARAFLVAITLACLHAPAAAQAPGMEAQVLELLTYSELGNLVGPVAAALPDEVLPMAGPVSAEREALLRQAIREEFSVEAVRADVVGALIEAGDPATVAELLEWLPAGATAELDRVQESYEPPLTLEEYAGSLEDDPPSQDRILTVAEWARTMQADAFYVAIQLAQVEAVHTIAATLNDQVPAFTPLTDEQMQQALQTFRNIAVLEFLWSLEPADDQLISRATAEYASPSGQWFVTSYSLAVEEAIDRAAARVADRMRR